MVGRMLAYPVLGSISPHSWTLWRLPVVSTLGKWRQKIRKSRLSLVTQQVSGQPKIQGYSGKKRQVERRGRGGREGGRKTTI